MSFNGSGSFLINTAGQPVVSGTVISSTAFNALTADLATGLSTCITKDGQTTVTANIPMANYKFTGLGAGSAATDSANLSQVQSTVVKLLASVSGTDTITAVGSPTVAAYAAGQMFYFVAAGDNTGAVTINIDSLGAKNVTRDGSVALAAGDIKSGEVVVIVYDGTRFQVVSQLNSSGDARFANVSIASALNVGGVATVTGGAVLNGGVVINEPGADVDFRVEGDTDANLIFADASTDRVGVGTNAPAYKLEVAGTIGATSASDASIYSIRSGGASVRFEGGSSTAEIKVSTNHPLLFFTNNTEKLRLTADGNLGLGVSPSAWGSGLRAIQIGRDGFISAGTTFSEAYVGANTYYDGSNWKYATTNVAAFYSVGETAHKWYTATSGTAGNNITFGDPKMTLDSSGRLGIGTTSLSERLTVANGSGSGAAMSFQANGVTSTSELYVGQGASNEAYLFNRANQYLVFGTNNTERARITSGGTLIVGATSTSAYFDGTVSAIGQSLPGMSAKTSGLTTMPALTTWNTATTGDNWFIEFATETAGTSRGSITYNRTGGVVAYNTTSDYRAKNIIGSIEDTGSTIDALKVYTGKMKDATVERPMLIAHEAQKVVPYAVTGEKDDVDENGNPRYQQMDHQVLVPLLIAEIQSLRARVAALEGA